MNVSIDDVVEAMEEASEGAQPYWDIPEGRVVWFGEDIPEDEQEEIPEEDLIALPDRSEINEYGLLEEFAHSRDGQEKEWLINAIKGKGAFRRFRATLERFGIEDDWYAFHEEALRQKAMEWCEDNGFTYTTVRPLNPLLNGGSSAAQQKPAEVEKKKLNVRFTAITSRNVGTLFDMAAAWIKENEGGALDMEKGEDLLEDALEMEYRIFSAVIEGRPIGFCILDDCGVEEADLLALYVRPQYRRQGIGRSLLEQAAQTAGSEASALVVKVRPDNKNGIAFARACGYGRQRCLELVKE